MTKVFGIDQVKIIIGFVLAVLVYLFWEVQSEDELLKYGAMAIAFLLPVVYDKLTSKKDYGDVLYTPDDLADPNTLLDDMIREVEGNSFDDVVLGGSKLKVDRMVEPPMFWLHIRERSGKHFIAGGNALKKAEERMMISPFEFERIDYLYGVYDLKELAMKIWPSRKILKQREYQEMLISDAKKRAVPAGGGTSG